MKYGLIGALVLTATVSVSPAHARLISAALPAPDESFHAALHRPTGCQAEVTFSHDTFIKAQITDPTCLPEGIQARDVPATLRDFVVTPR